MHTPSKGHTHKHTHTRTHTHTLRLTDPGTGRQTTKPTDNHDTRVLLSIIHEISLFMLQRVWRIHKPLVYFSSYIDLRLY